MRFLILFARFSSMVCAIGMLVSLSNAQVVITEFMADNKTTFADEDGTFSDWVEIHNPGGAPVSLNGWYLTDNANNLTKWRFPDTNIAAGSYMVVWASSKNRTDAGAPLHTSWALSTGGEYLGLVMSDGATIVSQFAPGFPAQSEDVSYGVLNGTNVFFGTPTPGAANSTNSVAFVADTKFSHARGFYEAPFNLAITIATPGASIVFTTNGTPPSLTNGAVYSTPVAINKTTVLRAAAFKSGFTPSNVDTLTFIFLNDVINQSTNGLAPPGWPASWGANTVDYGMDLKVITNPVYSATIKDDLKAIPTISMVMRLDDLFNPTTGIYANSSKSGMDWERPASWELIYPDGTEGFQVNAGVRIRGNFSALSTYPKHSFRGFFRSEYGDKSLDFPLFGANGSDTFHGGIDLATFQNHAWANWGNPGGTNALFLRDHFGRDTQLAMGHQGERGIYTHLYINGQYWGIYSPSERPEASFASTYYGGSDEDYDVVKATGNAGKYTIEATDGDMNAWARLWEYATNGFSSEAAYQRVQGNNPDGTRNPEYDILVDVENLIDYMLIVFYTGSRDAPLGSSGTAPNNWFGIHRRDGSMGFRFFVHDFEHSLLSVNEDRLGPYIAGSPGAGGGLLKSSPQYIFQQLQQNAEFRMLVADHVHRHFFNGGVLTVESNLERFKVRTNQLHRALVGESARWGDADPNHNIAYTRDGYWLPLVDRMLANYFPQRTGIVLNQLKSRSLYPNVVAPSFTQHGGFVTNGFLLDISAPAGTIFFTTDGSDPRLPGGAISPLAQTYSSPLPLFENVNIKSRVWTGSEWSAVNEAKFVIIRDYTELMISEVMYHPPDVLDIAGDEFEFIELKNVAATSLNLSGVHFTNGLTYTFPDGTLLEPGEFIVLVSNPAEFANKYPGVSVDGVYTGRLSNSGEQLTLVHAAGAVITSFNYLDDAPWPTTADGSGFSLVPKNPNFNPDPNNALNWRASANLGGSPGADDPTPNIGPILVNEVLAHTDSPLRDSIELFNPTTNDVSIGGWFLTDKRTEPLKYRIPDGTMISANGFLAFTDAAFNANPGSETNFSLSSHGEEVYLYSADPVGNLTGYSHGFSFGASENAVSFGRYVTSTGENRFPAQIARTFGATNSGPRIGPIVINEIGYRPVPGDAAFVELKNISGSPVKLYDPLYPTNTWQISGIGFSFPTNTELAGGVLCIVTASDPAAFRARHNVPASVTIFGPYSGNLQDNGELLRLQRPDKPDVGAESFVPYITVDDVRYSDKSPWPVTASGASLERIDHSAYGNDPINWRTRLYGSTPGLENNLNLAPFVNAGEDFNVAGTNLPLMTTLSGTALDDGFPISPGTITISWTQVSGPATVLFSSTNQTETSVTFPAIGTYVLRLSAADGELESSDDITLVVGTRPAYPVKFIPQGANWKYLDNGTDQGTAWRVAAFNDASWSNGVAQLGYGDGDETTVINFGVSTNKFVTSYFRKAFVVNTTENINGLALHLLRDDGAVVYLNNTEVFRSNMPEGPVDYLTLASSVVEDESFHSIDVSPALLVNGLNVVAVEVHQANRTGGDMSFDFELNGTTFGTNQSPIVNAGSNFSVRLPQSAELQGSVTDDGLPLSPGIVSMQWTKTSGPDGIVFANSNSPMATVDFSAEGVYTFRLTADDGVLSNFSIVTVYVLPETFSSWGSVYFSSNQLADPNVSGNGADPDGDGFTNDEEFTAGTNPLDDESYLRIESFDYNGAGVSLNFEAAARRTYSIQYRDGLESGNWSTFTNITAENFTRAVETFNPSTNSTRYYRVVVPAQP